MGTRSEKLELESVKEAVTHLLGKGGIKSKAAALSAYQKRYAHHIRVAYAGGLLYIEVNGKHLLRVFQVFDKVFVEPVGSDPVRAKYLLEGALRGGDFESVLDDVMHTSEFFS